MAPTCDGLVLAVRAPLAAGLGAAEAASLTVVDPAFGQVIAGFATAGGVLVVRGLTLPADPLTGRSCERASGALVFANAGVPGAACNRVATMTPLTTAAMRAVPRLWRLKTFIYWYLVQSARAGARADY